MDYSNRSIMINSNNVIEYYFSIGLRVEKD